MSAKSDAVSKAVAKFVVEVIGIVISGALAYWWLTKSAHCLSAAIGRTGDYDSIRDGLFFLVLATSTWVWAGKSSTKKK